MVREIHLAGFYLVRIRGIRGKRKAAKFGCSFSDFVKFSISTKMKTLLIFLLFTVKVCAAEFGVVDVHRLALQVLQAKGKEGYRFTLLLKAKKPLENGEGPEVWRMNYCKENEEEGFRTEFISMDFDTEKQTVRFEEYYYAKKARHVIGKEAYFAYSTFHVAPIKKSQAEESSKQSTVPYPPRLPRISPKPGEDGLRVYGTGIGVEESYRLGQQVLQQIGKADFELVKLVRGEREIDPGRYVGVWKFDFIKSNKHEDVPDLHVHVRLDEEMQTIKLYEYYYQGKSKHYNGGMQYFGYSAARIAPIAKPSE
ncbi:hypothetical protein [Rubritalea halochordaticola]|uniref:hypothetical protein n=1 Tax=Rubritalea halochordaticola TaxID=714537 RepID=UPI0031FBFA1B